MKYAVRTNRETADKTGRVTVHPVFQVRDSARGYRIKYVDGTAERLQVFDTPEEAKRAYECEVYAAAFAEKSPEELMEILRRTVQEFKDMGFDHTQACRMSDSPYQSIRKYLEGAYNPSSRVVAKFALACAMMKNTIALMKAALPHNN